MTKFILLLAIFWIHFPSFLLIHMWTKINQAQCLSDQTSPVRFHHLLEDKKKKAGLKVINRFGHFHYQTKHLACYKAFIICYLCNPHWHKANRENLSFEIQIPLLKSKTQYFPSISHSLFICFLHSQICRFLHFSLSFHKPATRYFEEAEHTTAVKVSTSDPFSFLDSKFIFIFGFIFGFTFNLWWCCFLLCSHRFFFACTIRDCCS
jgi:hypothetical protein